MAQSASPVQHFLVVRQVRAPTQQPAVQIDLQELIEQYQLRHGKPCAISGVSYVAHYQGVSLFREDAFIMRLIGRCDRRFSLEEFQFRCVDSKKPHSLIISRSMHFWLRRTRPSDKPFMATSPMRQLHSKRSIGVFLTLCALTVTEMRAAEIHLATTSSGISPMASR